MGRDQKSEAVRNKVANTAFQLFIERGYAETTIREISSASGVSTGSIYHFYGDKEGIFQQVAIQIFQLGLKVTDRYLTPQDSPYLHLAIRWAGVIRLISRDPRIAEIFLVAYRSWKISDTMLPIVSKYHHSLLSNQLADWTQDDIFSATLLLQGSLSSLVDERLHQNSLSEEQRIRSLLIIFLPAFGADQETTKKIIDQALSILPDEDHIFMSLFAQDIS